VQLSVPPNTLNLRLQLLQPSSDQPSVSLDLSLSRSSGPNAATQTFKVSPLTREARQQVLVLREIDLKASLTRPCSRSEHIENQGGPVEYLSTAQLVFKVTLLCWCQLVIANDRVDIETTTSLVKLFDFALTKIRVRCPVNALCDAANDGRTRGTSQLRQLVQRVLRFQQRSLSL
jgi:hypothetical protein